MTRYRVARAHTDDEGFGLVEIVVSMLLLAIIAAAFLPVLATTIVQSAKNATTTTATQMVNDQLERARTVDPNCAALEAFEVETILSIVDSRNVPLQASRVFGECPTTFPGTMRFTATVTRTDTNEVVANATTLIYVEDSP